MTVLNKYKDYIPPEAIYIGRGTLWGNPFPIDKNTTREQVIGKYIDYIKNEIRSGRISLEQLASLYNQDLVCYCAPKACHGDVLEKLAAWAYQKLNTKEI